MKSPIFQRCLAVSVAILAIAAALAQDSMSEPPSKDARAEKLHRIVPLVTLKPGETKKLLLSTFCTVGATRAGGFSITEMRDGVHLQGDNNAHEGASYSREGIVVNVPGWDAAEGFAASPPYASLKKAGISVFEVTISASSSARPGLADFHLLDATCSGQCETDFRVLVVPL